MTKQQTKKSRWPSKYKPSEFVTAAQYITEIICEKKALADSGGRLPILFWTLPKWKSYFKQQIPAAYQLLKEFTAEAIVKALQSHEADKVFSLRAPFLKKIIQKHQAILNVHLLNRTKEILLSPIDTTVEPIKPYGKPSKLNSLDE